MKCYRTTRRIDIYYVPKSKPKNTDAEDAFYGFIAIIFLAAIFGFLFWVLI